MPACTQEEGTFAGGWKLVQGRRASKGRGEIHRCFSFSPKYTGVLGHRKVRMKWKMGREHAEMKAGQGQEGRGGLQACHVLPCSLESAPALLLMPMSDQTRGGSGGSEGSSSSSSSSACPVASGLPASRCCRLVRPLEHPVCNLLVQPLVALLSHQDVPHVVHQPQRLVLRLQKGGVGGGGGC